MISHKEKECVEEHVNELFRAQEEIAQINSKFAESNTFAALLESQQALERNVKNTSELILR